MKIFALGLVSVLTPGLAFAHGGHPEVGGSHELYHVFWLLLPVTFIVGLILFAKRLDIRKVK